MKKSKEYRHQFVSAHVSNRLAYRLRSMREARGLTQAKLGEQLAIRRLAQSGIARLENSDFGSCRIDTLKRLAFAFDVALFVDFIPFSELLDRTERISPDSFDVVSFEKDTNLYPLRAASIDTALVVMGTSESSTTDINLATAGTAYVNPKQQDIGAFSATSY